MLWTVDVSRSSESSHRIMLRARDAMDRDFARVLNVGEPAAIAATRRGRIEA
jgi:hypothetical protein